MNYKNILAIGGLCAALTGCGPSPTMEMKIVPTTKAVAEENSAYSVTRVGIFQDDLAFGSRRGVYEIIDNRTGKKYVGVSGIGICELGSHPQGKMIVPDER